jgi:hypothetical protein
MIGIEVRRELRGEVLARAAGDLLPWEITLSQLDQTSFPLLGAVDPYGDAVFNRRQIPAVLDELARLPTELGGPWVAEVRTLAGMAQSRPHRYLVFVGD